MNVIDIMKRPAAYASGYENIPGEEQNRAKQLCWEYNRTAPKEQRKRREILQELLGTCHPMTGIEPDFHCDYGFNIHTKGLAVINYNCVMLDTSPIHIGENAFIRPGTCLTCAGHAIDAKDVYRNCSEEYEDMDVLQIAQNVASDYATQPAYSDPMPVQQGETELEQIEHLHQLKEKGILTEKEFQEKKKQLLSQL